MNKRRWPLAALALLTLISGCGSSTPAATGTAGTAGAGGGNNNIAATARKAVKFSECMRANGVSQFPDPGPSGKLTIDAVANGSSVDTSAPAFMQAVNACKDLEPAGFTGTKRSPQQQSGALKFAQCIREHGVKDFPDPINGQPLVDTYRIPSSNRPGGMAILNAAMRQCSGPAAEAGVQR